MTTTTAMDRLLGFRVNPDQQRVVKFWPNNPPRRGDIVLVEGIRCRVTHARIEWDGPQWTIRTLRAKEAG